MSTEDDDPDLAAVSASFAAPHDDDPDMATVRQNMQPQPVSGKESVAQMVRHEVSRIPVSIAGGARSIYDLATGKSVADTDRRYRQFVQDNTYPVTDPNAQALTNINEGVQASRANPLTWPTRAADLVGAGVNKVTGSTDAGPIVSGVLQGAAGLAGLRGSRVGAVPAISTDLADAQRLGYVVPPATSNPSVLNRVLEGTAGKLTTAQAASMRNQGVTNGLVRQELGIPKDVQITPESLQQVRDAQGKAYQAVGQVPDIEFGPSYEAELNKLNVTPGKISAALPNYRTTGAQQVQELLDSLKPTGGKMDGEVAVELSKSLRAEAASHEASAARSGDPKDRTLARAYRGAGEAVENAIENHLTKIGQPELATNWDNARRNIAKTYSVQQALDGAGNVDATKLGKQLIKGKPLSGNLEAAANFANAYPKAARNIKESSPGMSPLDVYASAAVSAATGDPSALLIGPGRMAARGALLGPLGQWLARPKSQKQVLSPSRSPLGVPAIGPIATENDNEQ